MGFVPRLNRKRSVARTEPSRAKSDVVSEPQRPALSKANGGRSSKAQVFEPQRGDLAKPRLKAWVNGTQTDT
jgi:hypothetical protein